MVKKMQLKTKNIEDVVDYEFYEEVYDSLKEKNFYKISKGYVAKEDVDYFIKQYKDIREKYKKYSPKELPSFNAIWGNFDTDEEIEKIVLENDLFIFEEFILEE